MTVSENYVEIPPKLEYVIHDRSETVLVSTFSTPGVSPMTEIAINQNWKNVHSVRITFEPDIYAIRDQICFCPLLQDHKFWKVLESWIRCVEKSHRQYIQKLKRLIRSSKDVFPRLKELKQKRDSHLQFQWARVLTEYISFYRVYEWERRALEILSAQEKPFEVTPNEDTKLLLKIAANKDKLDSLSEKVEQAETLLEERSRLLNDLHLREAEIQQEQTFSQQRLASLFSLMQQLPPNPNQDAIDSIIAVIQSRRP